MAIVVDEKAPANTGAQAYWQTSTSLILPDFSVFGDAIEAKAKEYCRVSNMNEHFTFNNFLTAASGIIGAKRQLKIHATWRVIPAIWSAYIGAPGTKKTPAALAAIDPIIEEQRRRRERFEMELAIYEENLAQYQRDAKAKKPDAKKPLAPILNSTYATSMTLEGLSRELSHNPGLLVFVDELAGWLKSFNKYRQGDDRQQWLSLWSGTPTNNLRSDPTRSTFFNKPSISILGGLQPSVLPMFTGNAEDGLTARFLYVYPDIETSEDMLELVDDPLHDVWARKCEDLYDLRESELAPNQSAKQAYQNWQHFWRERFDLKEETPLNYAMLKMEEYVWRFAIIAQTLYDPENPYVDFRAIQHAIRIADYYYRHLVKVYDTAASDELDALAQRVVKWAMNKAEIDEFKPRDIVRSSVLPRNMRKTTYAVDVMREVLDRGYMKGKILEDGMPILIKSDDKDD